MEFGFSGRTLLLLMLWPYIARLLLLRFAIVLARLSSIVQQFMQVHKARSGGHYRIITVPLRCMLEALGYLRVILIPF